ncbi:MAG: FAD-binding oxidoreductase [Acidobacteria bacterium]|nr:FAD-binding oxidoreductase [Acidobacteriota bacterium]
MSAAPRPRPFPLPAADPRRVAAPRTFDPRTARELARALERAVDGEVRFDDGSRALYATDASNYRLVPIGVVVPATIDDVVATVALANQFDAPVLARGGGTSLCGQCCNVAVVIDFSKHLRKILEIDTAARTARVQPGVRLDELRAAAEEHGLTFGPDPATHKYCTLGGMIGNNSCGVHSVMAGRTADNVESLEVLTYDGLRLTAGRTDDAALEELCRDPGPRGGLHRSLRALRDRVGPLVRSRYPQIPRRVSGYNLDELLPENGFHLARALVGSEGTCVTVLEATLRLVPSPRTRSLLVLGYHDVYAAADDIEEILEAQPIGCEGIDDVLVGYMKKIGLHVAELRMLPAGNGWLLVEFGGDDKRESDDRARALMDRLRRRGHAPAMKLYDDPLAEAHIWEVRESGLGATAHVPGEPVTWEGWEDSAVPPERLAEYLRALRGLFHKFNYQGALYGHFGQGCVHTRINFDLVTQEGIRTFENFLGEAADLVVSLGGSISGEHGDGQSKAALLPRMFGSELVDAFREFKHTWDPRGRMNPGRIVDADAPSTNLRLGVTYRPSAPRTYYEYPADAGNFPRAMLRCVGVGKCRQRDGFMCPSYHATLEEKHSTRGRARLLWEMLNGNVLERRWRSAEVLDALDLCLSCKGCKAECPVKVDMALYKSEFLAQHYHHRLRPRRHYAFGLVGAWARLGQLAPGLANVVLGAPLVGGLAHRLAGVAPQRELPRLGRPFSASFRSRGARDRGGPAVIVWPDAFTDTFYPEVGRAAIEVLERLGFEVRLPRHRPPAIRPMVEYGFLGLARAALRRVLRDLRSELSAGLPIIGLEPSVVALYRDELLQFFPHDLDAQRLARRFGTFGEFLVDHDVPLPAIRRRALLHVHCHEKAVMHGRGTREALRRMQLDVREPEPGCCGMAGAFGFESGHYEVSMKVGEARLLPAVRAADPDELLIGDGFSCRTQVLQATGRRPQHLAEVLRDAL